MAEAPREKLAYVAAFARPADKPDAIAVVDVDPDLIGQRAQAPQRRRGTLSHGPTVPAPGRAVRAHIGRSGP